MSKAHRRTGAVAWIYAGAAAVFALIGLAILIDLSGYGMAEVFHPAMVMLWGIPLAVAGLLCAAALRAYHHRPTIVSFDAGGVTLAGRAPIPWSEIGESVLTTQDLGYGPREYLTFRRHFTPSDIAATGVERAVHNLFTDQSFAPVMAELSVAATLTEIDAYLAASGLVRTEPQIKRFRLVQSTRRWEVRRSGDADAG